MSWNYERKVKKQREGPEVPILSNRSCRRRDAGQNRLKVKMKKTPKGEERQFAERREHQVQFRMNEKEYPCLDTSLMKFHNQGLRENPKSLREKTGYLYRQTTENKHIKIKYPPKERENPLVAIWSRI